MSRRRISPLILLLVLICSNFFIVWTWLHTFGDRQSSRDAVVAHESQSLGTNTSQLLYVEPVHGLGNRLRAYASAAALARKTNRSLVVVWIPDVHVNARFSDLFDTSSMSVYEYPVLQDLKRTSIDLLAYDYMLPRKKDELILDLVEAPIYIRTAYVIQSQTRVYESDIASEIRLLKPADIVYDQVNTAYRKLPDQQNVVGVHIRMLSSVEVDVPGISGVSPHDISSTSHMGPVKQQRDKCHVSAFIPVMHAHSKKHPDVNFLVTSDTPEVVPTLRKVFGSKIISFEGTGSNLCYGQLRRGRECLQSSLAQFILLARASSTLILSDWSSASELIRRLAPEGTYFESGCFQRLASPKGSLLGFAVLIVIMILLMLASKKTRFNLLSCQDAESRGKGVKIGVPPKKGT